MNASRLFGVGVSVIALSACGSSHRVSYSVPQVESAFAAQGIRLHPSRNRSIGVLRLVGAQGVRVLVVRQGDYSFGWTGERPAVRGNVTAFRGSASGSAVDAAMRELH